jgi:SIR2-like protein
MPEPVKTQLGAPAGEIAHLDELAESVAAGECILFLGAGVHYPPPEGSPYQYPPEQRPPLGGALARHLAERCNLVDKYPKEEGNLNNLARVSLFYEILKSRGQLVDEVKKKVADNAAPSPAVRALAGLKFPLVITTNYDQLFETALTRAGKRPLVGVYDPAGEEPTVDYTKFSIDRPFVFKMHGDIDKPASLVITDEDYIQFVLRMSDKASPVPETFQFYFKRWTTLFVGYSLMDYNLRLLFKTLRWKVDPALRPDTYSLDLHPDPLILEVWEKQRQYVRFIAEDVWKFVPALYQRVTGNPMPA